MTHPKDQHDKAEALIWTESQIERYKDKIFEGIPKPLRIYQTIQASLAPQEKCQDCGADMVLECSGLVKGLDGKHEVGKCRHADYCEKCITPTEADLKPDGGSVIIAGKLRAVLADPRDVEPVYNLLVSIDAKLAAMTADLKSEG